jgi:hypothetical protein
MRNLLACVAVLCLLASSAEARCKGGCSGKPRGKCSKQVRVHCSQASCGVRVQVRVQGHSAPANCPGGVCRPH